MIGVQVETESSPMAMPVFEDTSRKTVDAVMWTALAMVLGGGVIWLYGLSAIPSGSAASWSNLLVATVLATPFVLWVGLLPGKALEGDRNVHESEAKFIRHTSALLAVAGITALAYQVGRFLVGECGPGFFAALRQMRWVLAYCLAPGACFVAGWSVANLEEICGLIGALLAHIRRSASDRLRGNVVKKPFTDDRLA